MKRGVSEGFVFFYDLRFINRNNFPCGLSPCFFDFYSKIFSDDFLKVKGYVSLSIKNCLCIQTFKCMDL